MVLRAGYCFEYSRVVWIEDIMRGWLGCTRRRSLAISTLPARNTPAFIFAQYGMCDAARLLNVYQVVAYDFTRIRLANSMAFVLL